MANPLAHPSHTQRRTLSALHRAFRFFLAHAGYCTPPGRAACALHLAKAERWMQDAGLYALWVNDDDADLSWMDEAERQRPYDVEGCVLVQPCPCHADREDYSYETFLACRRHCHHARTDTHAACREVASLWSIVDATAQYRRVVEAELAAEAMPESPLPISKALIARGY